MLVIGECVADIVRRPGAEDQVHAGGSPANVAYGLARLGHETHFLTQLGGDSLGRLIARHLRSGGVRVHTDGQEDVRTPSALVRLDERGAASYTFDITWTLRDPGLHLAEATDAEPPQRGPANRGSTNRRPSGSPYGTATPRHVHLGSLAASLAPGADTALRIAERHRAGATVSYDPNVRPALLGAHETAVAQVERCVALSDLVKASDEDLAWLYPHEDPRSVATRWVSSPHGPSAVLVTRGAEGAFVTTARTSVEQPPLPVAVADTVGAGDAFMAGALHALDKIALLGADKRQRLAALDTDTWRTVLLQASTVAALTVSRPGANPPDHDELSAALRRP